MMNTKNTTLAFVALVLLSGAFVIPRIFMAEAMRSKAEADRMMAELEVARANAEKAKHDNESAKAAAEKAKFEAEKANVDRLTAEDNRKHDEQKIAAEEKAKLARDEQNRFNDLKNYAEETWKIKNNAFDILKRRVGTDVSPPLYPKPTKIPDLPDEEIDRLLRERNRVLGIAFDSKYDAPYLAPGAKAPPKEFDSWPRLYDTIKQLNNILGLAPDDYRLLADYPPLS